MTYSRYEDTERRALKTERQVPRVASNIHATLQPRGGPLRILERPESLAKLITLMNAVALGVLLSRERDRKRMGGEVRVRENERREQERHLHEARPHVNSWVRIRSRLRPRCWDIWCSSESSPLREERASERTRRLLSAFSPLAQNRTPSRPRLPSGKSS